VIILQRQVRGRGPIREQRSPVLPAIVSVVSIDRGGHDDYPARDAGAMACVRVTCETPSDELAHTPTTNLKRIFSTPSTYVLNKSCPRTPQRLCSIAAQHVTDHSDRICNYRRSESTRWRMSGHQLHL
jgi:hypothetical protein